MEPAKPLNLTLSQKLQLAAGVFAIYWPLRFFINLESLNWQKFSPFIIWIWLSEIPITITLFTGWLSLTEWIENRLYHYQGRRFGHHSKLALRLTTLLIAGMLSVGFDWAFFGFLHQARVAFDKTERLGDAHFLPKAQLVTSQNPTRAEGQRKRKATTALTIMALLMGYYLAANRRGDKVVAQLQLNAEQLKREAYQAQFDALKNQVNPHFLFNSLSILSSLVEVNPKLSIQFINQLAKAYRYILEQRDSQRVNLKTELNFLEVYCFLLMIRFDDKLQLENAISPSEAIHFSIAPLTLQLLVENAVKHNQMSRKRPLIVTLRIDRDYLVISNPIQPRLPDDTLSRNSTGLGLTNITNRYRLLTDRPVLVTPHDSIFVVRIPLLS
ncbi:hypothetical protein GCM10028806_39710 [Spirosoma terrae]|uniref:Histidine kinase n=1 Tax=Spirosoma terrae TaxID=1968276 RepID=A0A6L9LQM8_9BACT|nr:histidine kinase [Spirosoma terrae]NDU99279.1 histidine kinase [Spirosoma terrae]